MEFERKRDCRTETRWGRWCGKWGAGDLGGKAEKCVT